MQKIWKSSLALLSVCIMLGCDLKDVEKDDRLNSETKTGEKKAVEKKIKPETPEKALEYVIKSLHTPYQNGEYLFKVFKTSEAPTNVTLAGKKGKYHLIFAKPVHNSTGNTCKTTVTYQYENYQGTDENIVINGELALFERPTTGASAESECCSATATSKCAETIDFRKTAEIGTKNVLNITGDFDAKLEFVVGNTAMSGINASGYEEKIFTNGSATQLKIVFSYDGKTLEMCADSGSAKNLPLFKKILKVTK